MGSSLLAYSPPGTKEEATVIYSDLSVGKRYPPYEQPGRGFKSIEFSGNLKLVVKFKVEFLHVFQLSSY